MWKNYWNLIMRNKIYTIIIDSNRNWNNLIQRELPEAAEKETDDETENVLLPDMGDIPDIETPDFSGFDDLGFSDDDLMMDEGMEGDEYYWWMTTWY